MKSFFFCLTYFFFLQLSVQGQDTLDKVIYQQSHKKKVSFFPENGMGSGSPNNRNSDQVVRNKSKGTGQFDATGGEIFKRKIISRDIENFKNDLSVKGTVTVKVCIDRAGRVTFAEIIPEESNIKNPSTLAIFLKAARSYRFQTLLIVPDEQCGKLVFIDGLNLKSQKFIPISLDSVILDNDLTHYHPSEIGLELIDNKNRQVIEIFEYGTVYIKAFFSNEGKLLSTQLSRDLSSIKDLEIHKQCIRILNNYKVNPSLLRSEDKSCTFVFSTEVDSK